MNITGFRRYAIEFAKFLEIEIYGEYRFHEKYLIAARSHQVYDKKLKECKGGCKLLTKLKKWAVF